MASLPKKDVSMGVGLILFGTLLGAAVYVSVGESVMVNEFVLRLSGVPGMVPSLLTAAGATSLISSLPANTRAQVLTEYNEALRVVFQVGLIPCCLSVLGAVSLEWNGVKKKQPENRSVGAETEAAEEKKKPDGEGGGRHDDKRAMA